ncbi:MULTISPECIES: acyl carrier protein [Pseudomonas]|uniref:acyl carrier protein n=1 Tax=Pseudomonas TaxID=286 RepID=UPI000BA40BE8|nr:MULTISPECIES: acyl carrier protein [Pseudomonas]MDR9861551.1 acyl carrier protein [Pseudomonas baetica]
MSTLEDRVITIISEQLGVDRDLVVPSANFVEDLGADSLNAAELVMALENLLQTEISDEEVERITTVQQALDYVL